jgi:hypothetical protein
MPVIVGRHWRFGPKDSARAKARQTAWCVACGTILEIQEEGTGKVLYSAFPHTVPAAAPAATGGNMTLPDDSDHDLTVLADLERELAALVAKLPAAQEAAERLAEREYVGADGAADQLREAAQYADGSLRSVARELRNLIAGGGDEGAWLAANYSGLEPAEVIEEIKTGYRGCGAEGKVAAYLDYQRRAGLTS